MWYVRVLLDRPEVPANAQIRPSHRSPCTERAHGKDKAARPSGATGDPSGDRDGPRPVDREQRKCQARGMSLPGPVAPDVFARLDHRQPELNLPTAVLWARGTRLADRTLSVGSASERCGVLRRGPAGHHNPGRRHEVGNRGTPCSYSTPGV